MEPRLSFFKRTFQTVQRAVHCAWLAVKPGPNAWRGAAIGVLLVGAITYVVNLLLSNVAPPLIYAISLLIFLILGGLLVLLGHLVAWIIDLAASIPYTARWGLIGGLALLAQTFFFLGIRGMLVVLGLLLTSGALVGGGTWALLRTGWSRLTVVQRTVSTAGTVFGLVGMIFCGVWFIDAGFEAKDLPNAAAIGAPVTEIRLADPSQPGPYAVKTLTYGSGNDRFRPEYAEQVAIKTEPVDASHLMYLSADGYVAQLREMIWGFGPSAYPLNGRVWYPEGDGPFPLVLMVHGNHNMLEFSDPGYSYLGELLASRGYILVSVDQNFINGGITDFIKGMSGENDARGWLLLEHLRVWHEWNDDPQSPFYGKVDTENLAVMGHSRGGEAAAVAALFNRLPYYPDYAKLAFDYNFNIRSVVAIAPIDGQYMPGDRGTLLENVNYFVLHGSHDADVRSYDGVAQYERVRFTDGGDWFKAGLYIYRANHGQFNSVWGDRDFGGVAGEFLNREALLSAQDQRKAASVYISAFLEATLKGQNEYRALFQDARAAGDGWLPDTIYINRYDTSADMMISTYEEDINLLTTTLEGGRIETVDMDDWYEKRLPTRWGPQETGVVFLGWNEDKPAEYRINLPESGLNLTAEDALIFAMADINRDPAPAQDSESADSSTENATSNDSGQEVADEPQPAYRQPMDLTLVLVDTAGHEARVPLSRRMLVQPQLEADVVKSSIFEKDALSEPVLQSYVFPLSDFTAANPAFDPAAIQSVRFVFDRTPRGSVILDAVGFRKGQ